MNDKRIFVFGLDGATWKLIDGYIKRGYLPFLKKTIDQGVKTNLISTIPPRTAPAWSSFITGQTPGEHGVFDFVVRKNVFGKEKKRVVNGSWLRGKSFWKGWNKKKRIGLINLPMTYPVKKINGVVVSSVMTPKGEDWFYPRKLRKLLEKVDYQIEDFDLLERHSQNKTSSREFLRKIKNMARARFELAKELLEKENWDFFFLLFSETDWIQHWFWRSRQTLGIYQLIDQYLASFYEILRKKYGARNFHFFVISDHGFHAAPKMYFNIYPWLRKNGFLSSSPKVYLAQLLRKLSFWEKDKTKVVYNDWGKSSIVRIDSMGIWLNKKVLKKNYSVYKKRLIEELAKLKYQNGKRVFKEVFDYKKTFPGKKAGQAWDISWLTNPYFYIGPCSIERKFFVPRQGGLPGIHDSDRKGIFLARGVGIKGLLKDWRDKEIHIWDMAKIFNGIFGCEMKTDDREKKVRKKSKGEEQVLKRLKALGYI